MHQGGDTRPSGGTLGRLPGPPRRRRSRRRLVITLVTVAVVIIALGAAGGGYLLLRTHGSPRQSAASYLAGWQRGSYGAMGEVTVNVPSGGLATPLRQAATQLGAQRTRLRLGQVTSHGSTARAAFTAAVTLASGHTWTYQGRLALVDQDKRWRVSWSPADIYPRLRAGERFTLSATWPARADILAADGTNLASPATQAQSGSLSLLTGTLVQATAAQARKLGAPYQKGDVIGLGGIQQAYQRQLAGRPALAIALTQAGAKTGTTVARFAAVAGTAVHTSIDMADQLAASRAVSSASTSKPVDMVALQPSTGQVLAVVERPGGFDRALSGIFPPGSTFKIVTGSALAAQGMRTTSAVQCPSTATLGGRTFHNDNNEHYGTTTLQNAFAVSCNTTFALLATQRLDGASLGATAADFGYNASSQLGIPATLGRFTTPQAEVDLAADAFGQGTDLVNPLSQATEAAAIEDGTWRPPVLVTSPAPQQTAPPHQLPAQVLGTLRPMMRAVVTSGTAASVGFPAGVYGKTGTAQYGSGPNPPSHGWFIGYRGDVAFAVLVEGGGTGANSAGPIANTFLRKLG